MEPKEAYVLFESDNAVIGPMKSYDPQGVAEAVYRTDEIRNIEQGDRIAVGDEVFEIRGGQGTSAYKSIASGPAGRGQVGAWLDSAKQLEPRSLETQASGRTRSLDLPPDLDFTGWR